MNKHTSFSEDDGPGLRFSEIEASFRLVSYCSLIEMMLDRLDRHIPADDESWTASQRRQWSRACGFLRASRTSLMRLMGVHHERIDDGFQKRRDRRGSKVRR